MPNEYEMEKLGIQLVDRKQLWAGIVFTNIERTQKTDDLPRFIQYKLRMDADTVDSTYHVEDRIPRPYPRRRPQIDLKYLYFGFSFLQVKYNKIAIKIPKNLYLLEGVPWVDPGAGPLTWYHVTLVVPWFHGSMVFFFDLLFKVVLKMNM